MARERIDAFVAGCPRPAAIAARARERSSASRRRRPRRSSFWAFRRALERLADERPLVVLVDDIHWAEPTLLDLIEHVADLARDAPMLLVCPARPELLDDRPGWGGGKVDATTILLEPLPQAASAELIDSLVPAPRAPGRSCAPDRRCRRGQPAVRRGVPRHARRRRCARRRGRRLGGVGRARPDRRAADDPGAARRPPRPARRRRARRRRARIGRRPGLRPSRGRRAVTRDPSAPRSPRNLVALVRKELIRPDRSGCPGETRSASATSSSATPPTSGCRRRSARSSTSASPTGSTCAAGDRLIEVEEIVGYHLEQAFRYRTGAGADRRASSRARPTGRRTVDRRRSAGVRTVRHRRDREPARPGFDAAGSGRSEPAWRSCRTSVARSTRTDASTMPRLALPRRSSAQRRPATSEHPPSLESCDAWRPTPRSAPDGRRLIADQSAAVFERLGDDRGLALCWQAARRRFVGRREGGRG